MEPDIQEKFERILQGELKYTSANLGFNMLISKLQRRVAKDPACMDVCLGEVDDFASRFPTVVNADFAKIAAL